MKIKPEHYDYMKGCIDDYLLNHPNMVNDYETGSFTRSDKVKDLQVRFNFDLHYVAIDGKWVCDVLYKYLNDTHIKTVLNRICPKVTRKY